MIEIIKWKKNQTKPEWLEARRKIQGVGETYTRIGASDVSTITGANQYKSKRRLFLELAGIYSKDWINNVVVLGGLTEGVNAQYFEGYVDGDIDTTLRNVRDSVRLRKVKPAEFFLLNEEKAPHIFISLDYIPDGKECTCPFTGEIMHKYSPIEQKFLQPMSYNSWGAPISQGYLEQVMIQLHITGAPFGIFSPLISDGKYYPLRVDYDPELANKIVQITGEFCRDVTKVKILLIEQELAESDSEKEAIQMQIEALIPTDDVVEDAWKLNNELHTSNTSELKQVEEFGEEDLLMEGYLQILQDEKDLDERKNFTKANLIRLAEGFEGMESETSKAIIRGKNSEKNQYFSVKRKTVKNK